MYMHLCQSGLVKRPAMMFPTITGMSSLMKLSSITRRIFLYEPGMFYLGLSFSTSSLNQPHQ